MLDPNELLFCFHCGDIDPEYTVDEYSRRCTACGTATVVSLVEAIDLLNDQYSIGNITRENMEDHIDEDFNQLELDFEDNALSTALDDEWENQGTLGGYD